MITAVIINGRHGGRYFQTEYLPKISIPIEKESQISMGENLDESIRIGDSVEYIECFMSADKKCVLYSTTGRWEDIKYTLLNEIIQTYPIDIFSNPFMRDEVNLLAWHREQLNKLK